MKPDMWWRVDRTNEYVSGHGLVYSIAGLAIKVLMADNVIKASLRDQWEVISENR